MPRDPNVLSRMDVLILSSLSRLPMHGYELELELRYRHVRWWAKLEHGHLYASLTRLERKGLIRHEPEKRGPAGKGKAGAGRARRVFAVTSEGRRKVAAALVRLGTSEDETFYDVDLFLSGAFLLERDEVVDALLKRRDAIKKQIVDAEELRSSMGDRIPLAGRLIIEHRIEHLRREAAFAQRAAEAIGAEDHWGPFLGKERITDFIKRTGVSIEQA